MKLEYEDKVNLVTSAIPRKNKATAEDFNDIKTVVNANDGVKVYDKLNNSTANITFDENISDYPMIEVFWKCNREVLGGTKTFYGSERIIEPIGKCFNVNLLARYSDTKQNGCTATYEISATGITLVASASYELNHAGTYAMNTQNSVYITRVLAYA